MTDSTTTSLNSLFAEIYEGALFVAREQSLMPGLVTNYSATGMQNRNIGIYPTLTAQEVDEGTDYANATEWTKSSKMALTPKAVITQVVLTDQRIATDPDDARRDAAREMGGAIATKIDTDLLDLFSGFDNTIGAAGSTMTIKRVAAGIAQLRNANAPNPIYAVLHPYHWHDVWVELGQPSANQSFLGDVANEAMRQWYVGSWINATWFVSANISVDSEDDAYSGLFNPEALALDTRKPPTIEPERDASKQAWELNMTAWYGVAERRGEYGCYLLGDAAAPDGS